MWMRAGFLGLGLYAVCASNKSQISNSNATKARGKLALVSCLFSKREARGDGKQDFLAPPGAKHAGDARAMEFPWDADARRLHGPLRRLRLRIK
jgi:hypothetical protein